MERRGDSMRNDEEARGLSPRGSVSDCGIPIWENRRYVDAVRKGLQISEELTFIT